MTDAKRRARGSGGLRHDEKRDLWIGTVVIDGKRRTLYGARQGEVLKKMRDAREEAPKHSGSTQLLKNYLVFWLNARKEAGLKPKTASCYSECIDRFLIPLLGDLSLTEVNALEVHDKLFGGMKAAGNSPRYQQLAHATLSTALSYAVEPLRLLPQNPVLGVKRPKSPKHEHHTWNPDEIRRFLDGTKSDRAHPIYVLGAHLGCREGELLGLHWSEVDFAAGTIEVRYNLVEEQGKILGRFEPKSETSHRTLHLTPECVSALLRHRAKLLQEGMAADPKCFPTRAGTYYLKSNFLRAFKEAARRLDLPVITFHEVRHSTATALINAGVPMEKIQRQLGHSGIAVTIGIYYHPGAEALRSVSDVAARVFGGNEK